VLMTCVATPAADDIHAGVCVIGVTLALRIV